MSEQELNSYRFLRGEEPSDEMLQAIMDEACNEAVKRAEEAQKRFRADYELLYEQTMQKWGKRIISSQNGQC